MKKTAIVCDVCNQKFSENDSLVGGTVTASYVAFDYHWSHKECLSQGKYSNSMYQLDLCEECLDKFKEKYREKK